MLNKLAPLPGDRRRAAREADRERERRAKIKGVKRKMNVARSKRTQKGRAAEEETYAPCTMNQREAVLSSAVCVCVCVCESLARHLSASSPREREREGKCALSSIHHSLITHSLTYTQTHTHTHTGSTYMNADTP